MRGLLALVLVSALTLAGCSGGGDGSSASASQQSSQASGSKSGTQTSGQSSSGPATHGSSSPSSNPKGNTPPTGTITANVPGGIPANVTFTMTGSDADKDPLSFQLDADGDGTADARQDAPVAMPVTIHFTYKAAGLYNVTYTLSDGKTSAAFHTLVNVSADGKATQTYSGHVAGPDPTIVAEGECAFALFNGAFGTPGGVAGDAFTLSGQASGWSYAFDITGMQAQFYDDAGYVGDHGSSGTVGDGATGVYVCSDMAANADYTLTLTAP